VDGKSASVKVSTSSQGDEEKMLNIVYPHGKAVVHDLLLGVFLVGATFDLQTGFSLAVADAAVLVVVLLVLAVFRRRSKPSRRSLSLV